MKARQISRFPEVRRLCFGRWPGRPSNMEREVIARALEKRAARMKALLPLLRMVWAGVTLGGRAPVARQCTKRLRTRRCRNWARPGSDRCHLHPRR